MRGEYDCLLPDAQNDIPFARIALQKHADAVNLWIGNSKSVTATHKDNFENIFVQIIGRKHFVLLPPVCQPCVNESHLMPATYEREGHGLSLRLDDNATSVPFATWDPDHPEANSTALSRYAHPIRVSLNPGDMLYLPAMWYVRIRASLWSSFSVNTNGTILNIIGITKSASQPLQEPTISWSPLTIGLSRSISSL